MKLQCRVELVNRAHSDLNLRTNRKYVKSTLALGRETTCKNEFFIIHFSTANKSGVKYKVKNIKQVFTKCINDGKSTIRFDKPLHDLCIESEAIQLKCFMKLLKSCITGDSTATQLAPLTSLSVTAKDNAPSKLVIHGRNEFPKKGLPRTLECLHMSGLNLCNFRREILLLKHLTVLDLSNNEIEKLPVEFGRMPSLTELYLQNNELGGNIAIDWRWLLEPQITKTLKLLDLSDNELRYLPKEIWKLQRLVTLKLDDNQLQRLPAAIGRISSLKYFTVSENKLQTLPCSILHCRLEYFDISNNDFLHDEPLPFALNYDLLYNPMKKLVNLAAIAVLKHKIYYAANIIPKTLLQELDDANMCICGAPTVTYRNHAYNCDLVQSFDLKDYFRVVVFDDNSSTTLNLECFFCSRSCLQRALFKIRREMVVVV